MVCFVIFAKPYMFISIKFQKMKITLLYLSLMAVLSFNTYSQQWVQATSLPSPNNRVTSLKVYNNELYVAGLYTTIGGIIAHGISKWNGSSWSNLGVLLDNPYNDLPKMLVFDNKLYITYADHFQWWDGVNMTSIAPADLPLGTFHGTLEVFNNELVGIFYDQAYKLTGGNWVQMGLLNFFGGDFEVYNNELYCGGGGAIKKWDGANWVTVSGLTNGMDIQSLKVHGGFLYAGGVINGIGGLSITNLARYNGVNWSDTGFNQFPSSTGPQDPGPVLGIYSFNDILYVGSSEGVWEEPYGILNTYQYNNAWSFVAGTISGDVICYETYNNKLFVGGGFYLLPAGQGNGNNLAELNLSASIDEVSNEIIEIYPNPSFNHFNIKIPQSVIGQNFIILDNSGRLVLNGSLKEQVNQIDVNSLNNGVYTIKIEGLKPTKILKQ
jgi:hypothetical protein